MPRIFRHYVPGRLLTLMGADGTIVFGSFYAGPAQAEAVSAAALSALVLLAAHVAGLYDPSRHYGRRELLLRIATALVGAYLVLAAAGPRGVGRKGYILSLLITLPLIFALRLAHDRLTAGGRPRRRVLLLGSGKASGLITEAVKASAGEYEVLGCLDDHQGRGTEEPNQPQALGSLDDLEWISHAARPDVVVVAMEERRRSLPLSAIVACKLRGIDVEDWPTFYERLTGKIPIGNLRPSWLVFADGFKTSRSTLIAKRAIDLLLAFAGCAVMLPLLPLIAALIKLDSRGPVFFRQVRLGQNARVFSVFKFRSMRAGAGRQNEPAGSAEGDSRVTRVGRVLRRTRLDEFPQLINVLRGEMSLIGPRPEWVALVPEFHQKVPFYLHRLMVKPGITGWAQVKNGYGASVENTLEKLEYDLYYIKNMSIFLDLLILLHTIQIVLFTQGSLPWTTSLHRESTTSVSSVA